MAFGACNDSMTDRCMGRLLPRSRVPGNSTPGVTPHPPSPIDPGPAPPEDAQVAVPARNDAPWQPGEPVASAGCARMLPPVTHTRDPRLDISQARQVLKDALRTQDARESVRWLEEHTHELTRSRFFELMLSFGPLAGTLLNAVGRLRPTERRLLGEALGRGNALRPPAPHGAPPPGRGAGTGVRPGRGPAGRCRPRGSRALERRRAGRPA